MRFNLFRQLDGAESGGNAATSPLLAPPHAAHQEPTGPSKIPTRDVSVFYGEKQALYDVSVDIPDKAVTAFIGPSGCVKSTFLRCLNRMNDTIPIARVKGSIRMDGEDIYDKALDPVLLRARVGMVFQKPNPFPKSIYENVAYGPRIHGLADGKGELDAIVEKSLKRAAAIVSFIRLRQRRKVDLPQPDGPMKAVTRSS